MSVWYREGTIGMSEEGDVEKSIAAAMNERRWSDARELIEKTIASMPADWRPIREDDRFIRGTFWDRDEFLAFVKRKSESGKSILWSSPSFSKMYSLLAEVNFCDGHLDAALLSPIPKYISGWPS